MQETPEVQRSFCRQDILSLHDLLQEMLLRSNDLVVLGMLLPAHSTATPPPPPGSLQMISLLALACTCGPISQMLQLPREASFMCGRLSGAKEGGG